jgi:hypothetical protein
MNDDVSNDTAETRNFIVKDQACSKILIKLYIPKAKNSIGTDHNHFVGTVMHGKINSFIMRVVLHHLIFLSGINIVGFEFHVRS